MMKERILVIDDEPDIVELIKITLERENYAATKSAIISKAEGIPL